MTTQATSRWRAALNVSLLDDALRQSTFTGIQKVAQQSALLQIPAIAASFAALTLKNATFTTSVADAAGKEQAFKASLGVRANARSAFDLELVNLKTLVENSASTSADITGMGLTPLIFARASQTPPDPPGALLVRIGKAHGKARVSVQGNGYMGTFVAEVSPNPVGTWSPLPGTGKQRKLAGYASGTELWVRFAAVRYGMQSGWSVPVLVTIP